VPVASGDKVEVLGVINGDELIPDKMIVSKAWAHRAIYLRSLLGLALVLIVFVKYWTFDVESLQFSRRTGRDGAEEEERNKEHA
jgi:glutathionyl-hydroquinone reductase